MTVRDRAGLEALVPATAFRRSGTAGVPLDPALYQRLDDETRGLLAADIAATFVALHRVAPAEASAAGAPQVPVIASGATFAAMAAAVDAPLLAAAARILSVAAVLPEDATVFGLFDRATLAFDPDVGRLANAPDIAEAAVGPLHRDLSSPCLVSPELAARVVRRYRTLSRRSVVLERVFTHHTVRLCAAIAAAPGEPARVWALSDWLAAVSRVRGDGLGRAITEYAAGEAARGRALARILNAPDGKAM